MVALGRTRLQWRPPRRAWQRKGISDLGAQTLVPDYHPVPGCGPTLSGRDATGGARLGGATSMREVTRVALRLCLIRLGGCRVQLAQRIPRQFGNGRVWVQPQHFVQLAPRLVQLALLAVNLS